MNTQLLIHALQAAHAAVLEHKEEIADLDQAIGDGDHVHNVLRGLEAVLARQDELAGQELTAALKGVARTLLETVGGSAGPLLASLVLGMAREVREPVTPAVFARMFASGVEALQLRGKAGLGEKTMLDVLIPTAEVLTALSHSQDSAARLEAVRRAAHTGMESTRDLVATKGRAAGLGQRAVGVVDPGARSSQVIITAICDELARRVVPV